ncbi:MULTISPECIES: hypothetical protein [unclassified Paenibacillus]|uniref:hypothetical protein n=1 Tax=unclassified Paenibacillus TaxID=185978 RepID=UPI000427236E|nr:MULTISPECIES: hypothetical protein [unclassified Paenibacillus]KGP82693.1 hypothetical protein P363_0125835 [Paenibacillus sp. MAEPY1]KGP83207.1 hypothetical protein P364_0110065 [Paenibacillus sp. MAEPY2]
MDEAKKFGLPVGGTGAQYSKKKQFGFNPNCFFTARKGNLLIKNVEGQEHIPIEVAILAASLFYRYKFLSLVRDKNLYRLPYWTRNVPIAD